MPTSTSVSKKAPARTKSASAARTKPDAAPPAPDKQPVIYIAQGQLVRAVDEVAAQLNRLTAIAEIYRCKGELVRPHVHERRLYLQPLSFIVFHELLDRAFEFQASKETRESGVRAIHPQGRIDCPIRLARILFGSPKHWTAIREIRSIHDILFFGGAA